MDATSPGRLLRLEGVRVEQACPACAAPIVHDRAFVPWCEACEWNVEAGLDLPQRPGPLAGLYGRLNRTEGESLYRQLLASPDLRPRPSVSGIAATLLSIAVLAGWLALVAAGIAIVAGSSFIVGQLVGVLVLGLAFATRPRLTPAPKRVLAREVAPDLYGLVDQIAGRLGAPRIHAIELNGGWNAATYRFGLRQRHAVELGLPLWESLTPAERVALLGHEIAHGVNGDTTRGIVVGNAIATLVTLGNVVVPDRIWPETGDGFVDLAAVPVNLVLLGVALGLYGMARGLVALTYRDGRRAEFYADRLAASLAGTDAARAMLAASRHDRAYRRALANTQSGLLDDGLWPELHHQRLVTPADELERLRRAERRLGSRLGDSHPPMYQREELLAAAPRAPASLVPDAERMARIDAGLAAARDRLDQQARRGIVDPDEPL